MSVSGLSMTPSINPSPNTTLTPDRILLNHWRPTSSLHRGQIIAFYTPHNPERLAVKRIIALEGDGVITKSPYPYSMEEVPVGHVWVEGDGPDGKSRDSNYYGPLSKGLIVGKVVRVVWPPNRWGRVGGEDWGGGERVVEGKGKVEKVEFY